MKNITILLFAFVIFLGGCANNSSREQEKQEKEKQRKLDSLALKIAVTPTLDCLPLFIAKEKDMFSVKELDVRLKRFKADMIVTLLLFLDQLMVCSRILHVQCVSKAKVYPLNIYL